MKAFWLVVSIFSALGVAVMIFTTVIVLTRPHVGHRGPVHWEAATILLSVAVGLAVLFVLSGFTCMAMPDE